MFRYSHAPLRRLPLLAALLLACLLGVPRPAASESKDVLPLKVLTDIVVDGVPGEAGWKAAPKIIFPTVTVPDAVAPAGIARAPDVRVGLAAGRLAFGVTMAEAPGGSIGMHLLIAPEGAKSAADAVSLDFRPVELRAPRYRVLGPRGVGRTTYRVEGAADISQARQWSLELAIPLADLVGTRTDQKLRVAAVVYTRTQNVISVWPAGATWKGPAHWTEVEPPEGGWPLDVQVDAARLAQEDAADIKRQAAWLTYLRGAAAHVLPVKPAAELQAELQANLIAPLAEVRAQRPDLAVPVHCLLGDVYHRLGLSLRAETEYQDALSLAPGWREAGFGLYVKVRGPWASTAKPGGPTDLKQLGEHAQTMFEGGEHPAAANYAEDGLTLAMALLAYKAGNFEWAERDLTTLAARYPFDAFLDAHRRLAIRGKRASGEEALRTKADEAKKLPRATIETTAGDIVLELFHDDARNTVFNFVWLAKHGFYDDCAIHRTVPAFLVQTGDPFSRKVSARPELVGSGTPGYAIRTELGKRWPLRGYVALANGGANTDGSQFMIFTGTAVHLHGEVTVFARVLEGLGIVERLQAGAKADRIVKVTVTGLDPERTYQPSTVAGNRAPAPRVPPVRGDPK